jgi:anaerobic selenocysteine-containing dehydrogenase
VLTGDPRDIGDGPPVTALLVQSTNPMEVAPETARVREGFGREDLFVCVHEQFMTATARMADIVLPATTFLEHDDIYRGGGHSHIMLGPKVIRPQGEARSNHDFLCALAGRLGARHRGFGMNAWEIIDETLRMSGYPSVAALARSRWLDCQPSFDTAHFLDGFATPDKLFHFAPDWAALGADHAVMPRLPDHLEVIEAADGEHPFRLVTAPARQFLNSSFTETPGSRKREGRPSALVHPDDLAGIAVADGERLRVGNRRGNLVVHAESFDGLQPGVVVIESVWPSADFEEGMGVNLLVGADAAPPAGGAVFHDTAVWLRPA